MKLALKYPILLALLFAQACVMPPQKIDTGSAPAWPEGDARPPHMKLTALSREEAAARAKHISHVSYSLWFGLDETHDEYDGRVVVSFDLRTRADEKLKRIGLDFEEGTVRSIVLNKAPIFPTSQSSPSGPSRFDGHRIYFMLSELQAGSNRIEIAFSHPYSHSGTGLHRFQDPVDKKVYLYSNFEPYDAHRMFPCFDQPDLKATYELTVETPPDWQVISNTLERDVNHVDGRLSWAFPPSPVLSTYLFALHAGPYKKWSADANGIPMRLFARQSLAKYVDYQEWFDITRRGLDFYGTEFDYPYPFAKYDQIIVPDFNIGAMENAGAVTFTERTIYRTKVTKDRHRGRADTILHEMAHMWFGDLVTMRWWNGLWLNESFATFMAARAVAEATNFTGSWEDFFGLKRWAYWEDQLVTTHPIEVPVPDTDVAESNFDGITYGKGAATLKQLSYFLGKDDFQEGVQRYFMKYAFRNTTTGDFMKMMAEASGQDMAKWQKAWLQTSGVNTVRAEWECDGSKIRSFALRQLPSEGNGELRTHKTEIGLYSMKRPGAVKPYEKVSVTYSDTLTAVPALLGKACPDFVDPNHGDYDYVKVELDPVSMKVASRNIGRFDEPLSRQAIWSVLWQMVVDGKMSAKDFADTALSQLSREKDTQVLTPVLSSLASAGAGDSSVETYLPLSMRTEYFAKIEDFTRAGLLAAPGGSDLQLVWFQAYLRAARTPHAAEFLRKLLDGKRSLRGFTVDQEVRWDLVGALSRLGEKDAPQLIEAELRKDPTDNGLKAAISSSARIPLQESKSIWLDRILRKPQNPPVSESELNASKLRAAMASYQILGQEEFVSQTVTPYFAKLKEIADAPAQTDHEYDSWFASGMYPSLCDPAIIEKTKKFLADNPSLPAGIIKTLKIRAQEQERCVRARLKALGETAVAEPVVAPAAPHASPSP